MQCSKELFHSKFIPECSDQTRRIVNIHTLIFKSIQIKKGELNGKESSFKANTPHFFHAPHELRKPLLESEMAKNSYSGIIRCLTIKIPEFSLLLYFSDLNSEIPNPIVAVVEVPAPEVLVTSIA